MEVRPNKCLFHSIPPTWWINQKNKEKIAQFALSHPLKSISSPTHSIPVIYPLVCNTKPVNSGEEKPRGSSPETLNTSYLVTRNDWHLVI